MFMGLAKFVFETIGSKPMFKRTHVDVGKLKNYILYFLLQVIFIFLSPLPIHVLKLSNIGVK